MENPDAGGATTETARRPHATLTDELPTESAPSNGSPDAPAPPQQRPVPLEPLKPPEDKQRPADEKPAEEDTQRVLEQMLGTEVPEEVYEDQVVERLKAKFGDDFFVTIRTLPEERVEEIEQLSQRPTTEAEKAQMPLPTRYTRDVQRYNTMICADAIIAPNFHDPRMIAKFGQPRGEEQPQEASAYWVAKRWLLPGERQMIAARVLELMGYRPGAVTQLAKK